MPSYDRLEETGPVRRWRALPKSLISLKAKGGTVWEELLTSTFIAAAEYFSANPPAGGLMREEDGPPPAATAVNSNMREGAEEGASLETRVGDRSIFPSDCWRQGSGAEN